MYETNHVKKDGSTFVSLVSSSLLKNERGELLGMMNISRDVTGIKDSEEQLKKALHEKEILLKEIHHRVKNNMQVISSILKLQAGYLQDKNTIAVLNECRNRINSMALIHASLYMQKDFSNVHFPTYVNNIATNLKQSYVAVDKQIDLNLQIHDLNMHIDDAIPCGLIINEILSNAFKYAFLNTNTGKINIKVQLGEGNIMLVLSDNGCGFPSDVDYKNTQSLGLQLVNSLVAQLSGNMELKSKTGTGSEFIIIFKQTK
jgi:two-component sensor histidine kinase